MTQYKVTYELGDEYWVAKISSVQACFTQGASLVEARKNIREALALMTSDQEAEEAELIDEIVLPQQVSRALQEISAYGIKGVDVEILLASHPA